MKLKNINLIAFHEAKITFRENSFKIIFILGTILIVLLHLLTQSNFQNPEWIAISTPSAIPFANAYIVNHFQILIIIFWAGNFLRKRQNDTDNFLSTRPFSNSELLFGKTFGFLIIMACMNLFFGIIALLIHIFASDAPFSIFPYLFYYFTLTIPTLLFTTGITICIKGAIRNLAFAYLLLLALIYILLFPGCSLLKGIFDPIASQNVHVFSDITGFYALNDYLLHRIAILLWGCGLISISIGFVMRLSNKILTIPIYKKIGILLIFLGCISAATYIYRDSRQNHEREIARELFTRYQNIPKINILEHDILFKQKNTVIPHTAN